MNKTLTDTEHRLVLVCIYFGVLAEKPHAHTRDLAGRIDATGKGLEDLTLRELIALNQAVNAAHRVRKPPTWPRIALPTHSIIAIRRTP